MNVVEVKGLCKSLGKKEILKNVSFTIVEHKVLLPAMLPVVQS